MFSYRGDWLLWNKLVSSWSGVKLERVFAAKCLSLAFQWECVSTAWTTNMLIEPFLQENNHFPGEKKKPQTLGTQQLHTNRKIFWKMDRLSLAKSFYASIPKSKTCLIYHSVCCTTTQILSFYLLHFQLFSALENRSWCPIKRLMFRSWADVHSSPW